VRFRRLTFGLGFWFSVLLPFSIPLMVAWSYLIRH
jgi:p-aminobenzoyl-glutamate transporter AbgT